MRGGGHTSFSGIVIINTVIYLCKGPWENVFLYNIFSQLSEMKLAFSVCLFQWFNYSLAIQCSCCQAEMLVPP